MARAAVLLTGGAWGHRGDGVRVTQDAAVDSVVGLLNQRPLGVTALPGRVDEEPAGSPPPRPGPSSSRGLG